MRNIFFVCVAPLIAACASREPKPIAPADIGVRHTVQVPQLYSELPPNFYLEGKYTAGRQGKLQDAELALGT